MQTKWRNALASGCPSTARIALSTAAMMGIAMSGLLVPCSIVQAQAVPAFEVSRVDGRGSGRNTAGIPRTPYTIAFQAADVRSIIAFAYELPLERIERRPQWMYDDRYDVAVTTADPVGLPEQRRMLQKLLEERFGLVVHRISTPSPVYFLVRGASANLVATQEDDAQDVPRFRRAHSPVELVPGTPLDKDMPRDYAVGTHVSMTDLALWLYGQVGLPVLDKTGITGSFEIWLPMSPRGGTEEAIRGLRSLGLDLELHKGTAESLIIDLAERPKEN